MILVREKMWPKNLRKLFPLLALFLEDGTWLSFLLWYHKAHKRIWASDLGHFCLLSTYSDIRDGPMQGDPTSPFWRRSALGFLLEGMMLKLKLQYFGHLMRRVDSLENSDAGRDWGQEEKGTTEDEMAGWHHWLDGRESEWTRGVDDGQGGLVCFDSWGCRIRHDWATELNWMPCTTMHRQNSRGPCFP